jgi:hypothetical protein
MPSAPENLFENAKFKQTTGKNKPNQAMRDTPERNRLNAPSIPIFRS